MRGIVEHEPMKRSSVGFAPAMASDAETRKRRKRKAEEEAAKGLGRSVEALRSRAGNRSIDRSRSKRRGREWGAVLVSDWSMPGSIGTRSSRRQRRLSALGSVAEGSARDMAHVHRYPIHKLCVTEERERGCFAASHLALSGRLRKIIPKRFV